MTKPRVGRRDFLRDVAGSAAAISILPRTSSAQTPAKTVSPKLKFAVIGINHSHINSQVDAVLRGGGELVSVFAKEPDLRRRVRQTVPASQTGARTRKRSSRTSPIQLVLSSGIPVERAPLGIRVMKHEKDYMSDKPGITTLEQLAEVRKVQAETKRIYSIMYSERFENRATVKAGELVKAGAIGQVIQTIGLGPHRITPASRPEWFWDKAQFGGILCDIGSHQADQFLYFTGSTRADVVSSQVGNVHHSDRPKFEDFGDVMLEAIAVSDTSASTGSRPTASRHGATAGSRFSAPTASSRSARTSTSADARARATCSSWTTRTRATSTAKDVVLPYGDQLVADVLNRTETAMSQAHCFLATELMLKAQAQAQRVRFGS